MGLVTSTTWWALQKMLWKGMVKENLHFHYPFAIYFRFTVKKAYYKLSLQVHPDRVPEEEKDVATEKFKVLSTINSILTDKDKKALYDEKQIIDDNDDEGKLNTWLDLWRTFFKPITTEDIDNFQRDYVGEFDRFYVIRFLTEI